MSAARPPVAPEVKAHPAYSDGYLDGFEGRPSQVEQSAEYYIGFEAGDWAGNMLADAGFARVGDGFAINLKLHGDS